MEINEIYSRVIEKLKITAPKIGSTFPHAEVNGKWTEENDITWWTNGFWSGILWLMYDITKDEVFKSIANECEDKLDTAFDTFDGLHHDVGFMWGDSAVANYKLTGNERSRTRALHAATLLAGRFDLKWGMIRAWPGERTGKTIIDCMLNIPILFWASNETKDMRFWHIAKAHADGVLEKIIRPDGTAPHICEFDSQTGEFIGFLAGQGYSPDSQWSRGQAWAIYGFTKAYEYTKDERYLNAAIKCADNFIEKCECKTPNWDFSAPMDDFTPDTSAGACAADGMITFSKYIENGEKYVNAAKSILIHMYENYKSNGEMILTGGTGAKPYNTNINTGLIYGDFYFLESLRRLCDNDYENIFI